MDFITPPMFDILNIQTWKVKMSTYLKALGIHVYFATVKNSLMFTIAHLSLSHLCLYILHAYIVYLFI